MIVVVRVIEYSNKSFTSQPPGTFDVTRLDPDREDGVVLLNSLVPGLIRAWIARNPGRRCMVMAEARVDPHASDLRYRRRIFVQITTPGQSHSEAEYRLTSPNGRMYVEKSQGFPFPSLHDAFGIDSPVADALERYLNYRQ